MTVFSGGSSTDALSVILTSLVALATVLAVRHYSIKRVADTTDREQLSTDETSFRTMLLLQLKTQSERIDHLEADLSKVRAEAGTATGQRNAAVTRAEVAEAEVKRLRVTVEDQDRRINLLEEQVRALKGQLAERTPDHPPGNHA